MSLISVIIPVYNSENYLHKCINSVIENKFTNLEIVLVDDGSEDSSASICQEYAKSYENIRFIKQDNQGVSQARNKGIKSATGKYIMFIDSDDFIESDFIATLYSNAEECDFLLSGYSIYDGIKEIVKEIYPCFEFKGVEKIFFQNIQNYLNPPYLLGPCFKLFRKDIIDQYNILFPVDLSYGEDAIFVLKYLLNVHNIKSCKSTGYYYRKHGEGTLSTCFRREMLDGDLIINKLLNENLSIRKIENTNEICENRLKSCYYLYCKRLINSKNDWHLKKEIFYEDAKKLDIKVIKKDKSFVFIPIRLALLSNKYFYCMKIYRIKPWIKKHILRKS